MASYTKVEGKYVAMLSFSKTLIPLVPTDTPAAASVAALVLAGVIAKRWLAKVLNVVLSSVVVLRVLPGFTQNSMVKLLAYGR